MSHDIGIYMEKKGAGTEEYVTFLLPEKHEGK